MRCISNNPIFTSIIFLNSRMICGIRIPAGKRISGSGRFSSLKCRCSIINSQAISHLVFKDNFAFYAINILNSIGRLPYSKHCMIRMIFVCRDLGNYCSINTVQMIFAVCCVIEQILSCVFLGPVCFSSFPFKCLIKCYVLSISINTDNNPCPSLECISVACQGTWNGHSFIYFQIFISLECLCAIILIPVDMSRSWCF